MWSGYSVVILGLIMSVCQCLTKFCPMYLEISPLQILISNPDLKNKNYVDVV